MSTGNYNTNQTRSFTHLDFKERQLIEKWLNEDVNKAEIGRRLGRNRSTIHREINRGKVEKSNRSMAIIRKSLCTIQIPVNLFMKNDEQRVSAKRLFLSRALSSLRWKMPSQKGGLKGNSVSTT